MRTSAKIGKQNGDTRTRKPEHLNLSNVARTFMSLQERLVLAIFNCWTLLRLTSVDTTSYA
jgi:hypothetical protein